VPHPTLCLLDLCGRSHRDRIPRRRTIRSAHARGVTLIRPDLEKERQLWAEGYRWVAGLDEAGRGAWAGPVVAAAVVLSPNRGDLPPLLQGVRDSKLLTSLQREALFPLICQLSVAVGVGLASAHFIDRWGIVKATQRAMLMALHNLSVVPQYLLIDALHLPDTPLPQQGLIKGDAHVLSIACASVVAKVFRDRCMVALDSYQPGYGFAQHKGYGTAGHRAALAQRGPCPSHRYSFAPLRALTNSGCRAGS